MEVSTRFQLNTIVIVWNSKPEVCHIFHGVAWISPEWLKKRGIDTLGISEMIETKLIELVDELISCQLPEDDTDESKCLNDIVSSVQKHHHTKSCLKYNGKCRYGYPKKLAGAHSGPCNGSNCEAGI